MEKWNVVIIDDEASILYSLRRSLECAEISIHTAASGLEGLALIQQVQPDAVITDVRLPDLTGVEVLRRIRHESDTLPVILITSYVSLEIAIDAMKLGATEYFLKPIDLPKLRHVMMQSMRFNKMHAKTDAMGQLQPECTDELGAMIGTSAAMNEVYKMIGRLAPLETNVLITGESGTGKELVASAIHRSSRRKDSALVTINCAAIPDTLLESELFGCEKGAFTGADRRRLGKFEVAHGGTLFLDEIGDMPLGTQAKMLRVLQDGRFARLGSTETQAVNVRILAATNQGLDALMEKGAFRRDLYYRLKGFSVHLPPLRDRGRDVPVLVDYYLRHFCKVFDKTIKIVTSEAMDAFSAYRWPGNVRELINAVQYAIIQSNTQVVDLGSLPSEVQGAFDSKTFGKEAGVNTPSDVKKMVCEMVATKSGDVYREACQQMDRYLFAEVLELTKGNQLRASEILGISRNTLRAKLRGSDVSMNHEGSAEREANFS